MAFIVKRDAVVIPAGIPVATTSAIKVLLVNQYDPYGSYYGNHNKVNTGSNNGDFTAINGVFYISYGYGNAYPSIVVSPNSIISDSFSDWGGNGNLSSSSTWSYYYLFFNYEDYYWGVESPYTNTSTDASRIPINGWSNGMTISIP